MKRYLIILLCVLTLGLCGCSKNDTVRIDAKVLSINSGILEGKMIGQFLGSSSGWIKSDVIKVGVEIRIGGSLFLEDLKLTHALLAYHQDSQTLPLDIEVIVDPIYQSKIRIRLYGYWIKDISITKGYASDIWKSISQEEVE